MANQTSLDGARKYLFIDNIDDTLQWFDRIQSLMVIEPKRKFSAHNWVEAAYSRKLIEGNALYPITLMADPRGLFITPSEKAILIEELVRLLVVKKKLIYIKNLEAFLYPTEELPAPMLAEELKKVKDEFQQKATDINFLTQAYWYYFTWMNATALKDNFAVAQQDLKKNFSNYTKYFNIPSFSFEMFLKAAQEKGLVLGPGKLKARAILSNDSYLVKPNFMDQEEFDEAIEGLLSEGHSELRKRLLPQEQNKNYEFQQVEEELKKYSLPPFNPKDPDYKNYRKVPKQEKIYKQHQVLLQKRARIYAQIYKDVEKAIEEMNSSPGMEL